MQGLPVIGKSKLLPIAEFIKSCYCFVRKKELFAVQGIGKNMI